jgi:hypothetical protein
MSRIGRSGYPFVAIGIAFLAIGISGRKAFLAIGLAFLVIGFLTLRRG